VTDGHRKYTFYASPAHRADPELSMLDIVFVNYVPAFAPQAPLPLWRRLAVKLRIMKGPKRMPLLYAVPKPKEELQ
jgi:hypothetical protein